MNSHDVSTESITVTFMICIINIILQKRKQNGEHMFCQHQSVQPNEIIVTEAKAR